jgi:hypothetical protein
MKSKPDYHCLTGEGEFLSFFELARASARICGQPSQSATGREMEMERQHTQLHRQP